MPPRAAQTALIAALESSALAAGRNELLLETGPYQAKALRLYAVRGYVVRGPLGAYPEHPLGVFMGKRLASAKACDWGKLPPGARARAYCAIRLLGARG